MRPAFNIIIMIVCEPDDFLVFLSSAKTGTNTFIPFGKQTKSITSSW